MCYPCTPVDDKPLCTSEIKSKQSSRYNIPGAHTAMHSNKKHSSCCMFRQQHAARIVRHVKQVCMCLFLLFYSSTTCAPCCIN